MDASRAIIRCVDEFYRPHVKMFRGDVDNEEKQEEKERVTL